MYLTRISAAMALMFTDLALAGPILRPRQAGTATVTVLDTTWVTAFLANPDLEGTLISGGAVVTAGAITATGDAVFFGGGFGFAESTLAVVAPEATGTGANPMADMASAIPAVLVPGSSTPGAATAATSPLPAVASSSPAAAATPATSPSTSTGSVPFLRGVNLGGWLILEKWMNPDAFTGAFANAVDEWSFSQISGAADALNTHWSTFFTESDIQILASAGINALRIPIGFWAYDNANTPYIQGADAYLEQAITWARNAGMKVWIDCHGSPGSQNGFDNSGHEGAVEWQTGAGNLDRSISVLKTMAAKYGTMDYADVVVGLELVNEPISWGANQFSITQTWAQQAYPAVKALVSNPNLVIVMHDAFEGPGAWTGVASSLNANGAFGIDTHQYQVFDDADNGLTQAQHIAQACSWASDFASANKVMPVYVGEWSPATNICVYSDGTTSSGTSCSGDGCQCESADLDTWSDELTDEVRRFVEAQLDVFESSTSGYFMWAANGPGAWGFMNGLQKGFVPNPVTSRKFPGQCGSGGSKREVVKGKRIGMEKRRMLLEE